MTEESILLHPDPGAGGGAGLRECYASTRLQIYRGLKHCRGQLFRRSSILLVTLFALQVCILVIQKSISIRMANYPYALALSQPICTTLLFMALYLITNIYVRQKAEQDRLSTYPSLPTDHVTQGSSIQGLPTITPMEPFPIWKFSVMGVLFTLSNFMLFAGSRGDLVPGPISVLLLQAVIPFSFILSFVFLGTRYRLPHYLGAFIVLIGIGLCLWPQFHSIGHFGTIFWAVILILGSAASTAAAMVLMEHSFKQCNMHLYHAWVWINIFEIIAALPLVFAVMPIQGIHIEDIPKNVLEGYLCLVLRHNSQPGDECGIVPFLFLAYMFALVANKVNTAYVVKYHSATQMWTAVTCAIPLANAAFHLHFIMGSHTSKFSPIILAALGVVFVGLLVYRSTKEKQRENIEVGEKSFWYQGPPT